jgi:succinylglutamate desuccinylase
VSIQKIEVVEEATLKPTGEKHSNEHVLPLQAMNEGINLLDGIAAGDEVLITCHVNGKETATIEGIRRWTDLRLASLQKLDLHV